MWRRAEIGAAVALLFAAAAFAQGGPLGADRAVPPTPMPVGSGARAAGMANAFVGIADDATAAAWNPAGLVQLQRPELSMVGEYLGTEDDFRSSVDPEINGTHRFDDIAINFMSFVYPVPRPVWNRNLVLSLSYQRRYDFTRAFDASLLNMQAAAGGLILRQKSQLDFEQRGGLGTLSLSAAYEITRRFSVGASLNLWRSSLIGPDGWEQRTRVNSVFSVGPAAALSRGFSRERYEDIRGESVTLGALWRATPRLSLGLRYDSPLRAEARYSALDRDLRLLPNPVNPAAYNLARSDEARDLRFPGTLSLGMAWRQNDRLSLAFDVSRTNWDDVYVKTAAGRKFSLVDGADLENSFRRTDFDPAWAARLGVEYALIPKDRKETLDYLWTLRGGLFWEQEPASGRDARRPFAPGDGRPDNFYGFAAGVGLLVKQRINLDAAYQFRFGQGINGDLNPGVAGFRAEESQHRIVLSTVIYF